MLRTLSSSAGILTLVIAAGGCQSAAPTDDLRDGDDIADALAALPAAAVLLSSADGVPRFVVGELGRIDPASLAGGDTGLRAALPPLLAVFRLDNEDLVLRKINTDELGARHYRYDQELDGLDVIGGDLVVHVDATGVISGANGTARRDRGPAPGTLAISEGAASLSIANDARWAGLADRTIVASRMVYIRTQEGTLHKAYEQVVEGTRGRDPVRDRVYVDVESGAVVEVHPEIHHARSRKVYSANNGTSLPGTLKRSEGQPPTSDIDVNSAYDHSGSAYDMYKHFWNRDSWDNEGADVKSVVHYGVDYCNAAWFNGMMIFGDGDPSEGCYPLARGVDVVAHELAHGVTQKESKLTYSGEPGGLNESLSDIWGAGVQAYVDGGHDGTLSTAPDVFLIGETVLPPFARSMCDPAADGASADIWYSGIGSIDVHYSSGPNNLAFCLLTKGGKHPRGKTNFLVPAIGMEKALRLMYKANVDNLNSGSNYAAMRSAMLLAAQQLGYDQATQDAVGCAYAAIKVGTAPASCSGSSCTGCGPGQTCAGGACVCLEGYIPCDEHRCVAPNKECP